MRINRYTPLVTLVLMLSLALPAHAYTGSNYISYDGTYCDWDGYNEHYDAYPNSNYSNGGGTTGIQNGYPYGCDRSRTKLRWKEVGQAYVTTTDEGYEGASIGPEYGMEYLSWTDHDVRIAGTSTWHGYRNSH